MQHTAGSAYNPILSPLHDAPPAARARPDRYAVCPSCCERQQIVGRPRYMTCQRCRGEFQVGWRAASSPLM
ncbi:MAG TPA: hypothetical protein VH158_09195 [Gemmatimonadales bacterium]|nr:hypothetical protein [Gemmatimonadales bacterium]